MQQTKIKPDTLILLDNVTIRIRDKFILANTNWEIKRRQHWAIIGPNGAGKTSLVRALAGEVPVVKGKLHLCNESGLNFQDHVSYVSFERHQKMIAREEARDASRYFSGQLDSFTTARQTLMAGCSRSASASRDVERVVTQLKIEHLLERGIRFLSTGEMRKVLIAQALIKSPKILILDEPFDALDPSSRTQLAQIINNLMQADCSIILVTHRFKEIVSNISHVLAVKDGNILFQGRRAQMLVPEQMKRLTRRASSPKMAGSLEEVPPASASTPFSGDLVVVKNARVKYEDVVVFDKLTWRMKSGENWAITGPNGSGKTSLLSLISADNPQAYANEIYLFGKRRGTGESIWDIKQRIGLVSSEFQIRYRKPLTAIEVVLSGFFDSVGLYRHSNAFQIETAGKWMEMLRIADKAERLFNQLSFGEQRMVLLARSMVKLPLILILDEPCQGLDEVNRKIILDTIDFIGHQNRTHILYVTHHLEEIPACMTHMLKFEKSSNGRTITSTVTL